MLSFVKGPEIRPSIPALRRLSGALAERGGESLLALFAIALLATGTLGVVFGLAGVVLGFLGLTALSLLAIVYITRG